MCTMHDFPRYSNCSSKNFNYLSTLILFVILIITIDFIILTFIYILTNLKTSDKHACPICGPLLVHEYADSLCKTIFNNHHRFVLLDHPKYIASKSNIPPQTLLQKIGSAFGSLQMFFFHMA